MFKGFKDFLFRGNVIDLSVAVVIGAAFTAVVTAFTDAFLKPLIQLLSPGGAQLAGTVKVDNVVFDYASFINQAITFFITAAVVYFLIVAPMKAIQARRLRGEESGPAQPTDVELLIEIRDLLQTQVTGGPAPTALDEDAAVAEPSPVEALAARLAVPSAAVASSAVASSPVPSDPGPATAPVPPSAVPVPAGSHAVRPHAVRPHASAETVPARPQRPAPSRPPSPQPPERPSRHSR
jgi:large conductance mechanosensitive channel